MRESISSFDFMFNVAVVAVAWRPAVFLLVVVVLLLLVLVVTFAFIFDCLCDILILNRLHRKESELVQVLAQKACAQPERIVSQVQLGKRIGTVIDVSNESGARRFRFTHCYENLQTDVDYIDPRQFRALLCRDKCPWSRYLSSMIRSRRRGYLWCRGTWRPALRANLAHRV